MESFISLEPNSLDLNPKYVSIIQSLVNSVGNSAGFIVPLIAAEMTKPNDNSIQEYSISNVTSTTVTNNGYDTSVWHSFFWLSSCVTFSGGNINTNVYIQVQP